MKAFSTFEQIGDTVYPVTYFPNGIVIVDYPTARFKELSDGDLKMCERLKTTLTEFRIKNNIKVITNKHKE